MKRRSFINNSGRIGAILLLAPQLIACKQKGVSTKNEALKNVLDNYNFSLPADAAYKINHVGGNVFAFEERGGTIGFYLDEKGIAVIDTQFPEQSQNLIDAIQSKVERTPIDLLINTHHHGDHTSGNIAFKGIISNHVAHSNSLKNQKRVATERDKEDSQLYPTTVFTDKWTSKVGNENITMRYFGAAHTDGDAVTTFENANVVHMGDLIFNRRFPYIDKSSGANIKNWITVLDKTLAAHNAETKYIFGHSDNGYGIEGSGEDIRSFQNYLENLLEFGMKSKKQGKTLEELIESTNVIPGAPQWKGKGITRSLEAVYEEV